MVPADSCRISRVPHYSGAALDSRPVFAYGALTPCGPVFQPVRLTVWSLSLAVLLPRPCRNTAGLGSCAFARHYLRNHCCFLLLRVLRWFRSPGLPGAMRRAARRAAGCPIRKSVLTRVFAPGHGLSQLVTSFFASESQGILHVPFSPFRFSFVGSSPFYALRCRLAASQSCLSYCLATRTTPVCVGIELPAVPPMSLSGRTACARS